MFVEVKIYLIIYFLENRAEFLLKNPGFLVKKEVVCVFFIKNVTECNRK